MAFVARSNFMHRMGGKMAVYCKVGIIRLLRGRTMYYVGIGKYERAQSPTVLVSAMHAKKSASNPPTPLAPTSQDRFTGHLATHAGVVVTHLGGEMYGIQSGSPLHWQT